jgi:hypothetical protein
MALATADHAARYSTHIDKHCAACGVVEDDAYLFFQWKLPRVVWFSMDPPLRTNNLSQENDGIQLTIQAILDNSTPNDLFRKFLITMWYL